mgnify:CR=1 FL=1
MNTIKPYKNKFGEDTLYHYRVIEMRGLIFRKPSYGIRAEVQENGICTYATFLPDISCDKDFVEALAQRFITGQLSPMHLLDAVLDALP